MGQLRGKIAIICNQKYTGSIPIQTSYRIYSLRTGISYYIHYCGTAFGVIRSGHTIFRLIEQYINFTLYFHSLILVYYLILTCNSSTEFGHDFSIDRDLSLFDQQIRFPSRANTGIAQELVQPDRLIRIGQYLTILYRHNRSFRLFLFLLLLWKCQCSIAPRIHRPFRIPKLTGIRWSRTTYMLVVHSTIGIVLFLKMSERIASQPTLFILAV